MAQFRSALSIDQALEGMNAAWRNARRLIHDANLLFEAGRYPTAASLGILAIEESSKIPILRMLLHAKDADLIKRQWKEYRNHLAKNTLWPLPAMQREGAKTMAEFQSLFDPKSEHRKIFDELKQFGFYTDCWDGPHWSQPENSIAKDLAAAILNTADVLAGHRQVTRRELEIWVEHVLENPNLNGREDLRPYYEALLKEGLAPVSVEEADEFIGFRPRDGKENEAAED